MMDNIREAFREEVAELTWIDSETKPRLYQKVLFYRLITFLRLPCCNENGHPCYGKEKKNHVFILVKIVYPSG